MTSCSSRATTWVSFVAECRDTKPGEHLRVVGSPPELGAWDPVASTLELQTTPHDFPIWRSDWVLLEQGPLEYKYVICGPGGPSRRWEAGANREVHVGALVPKGTGGRLTVVRAFDGLTTECRVAAEAEAEESGGSRSRSPPLREQEERRPAREAPAAPSTPPRLPPRLPTLPLSLPPSPSKGDRSPAKGDRSPMKCQPSIGRDASGMLPSRSASMCMLTLSAAADSPAALNMRRWASIGCIAELPDGMVPTRRALGLTESGSDLIREANFSERLEPEFSFGGGQQEGANAAAKSPRKMSVGSAGSTEYHEGSPPCSDSVSKSDNEESSSMSEKLESEDDRSVGQSPRHPQSFEELYGHDSWRLGSGAFGVVYGCLSRRTGRHFAVKVVNKERLSPFALSQLLGDACKEGEIRLHRSLPPHRNIVGLHECFEEPWGVRLVMDLCLGGDLFDAIINAKRSRSPQPTRADIGLTERAARNVLQQVLSAVDFCHTHGVVHRDLKAENVLIERPVAEVSLESPQAVVKLCDFGLAARCWSADRCLTDPVGSPDYIAPEVARMEPYGRGVDVWSCGALLFVGLRGCMPFPGKTDYQAIELVRAGNVVFDSSWDKISPEARACVQHLMTKDVALRPTARQALDHPWLRAGE